MEASMSKPKGDDFYEGIEAPKFVDFTKSGHYLPDDRYWFCLRVGCDQKHEEEMDSEAIYKNFVLRVMAARSPNVRLRRALTRKPPSTVAKCPLSAPAKPSRSRMPRLAVLSSISGRIAPGKERVKSVPRVTATPNAKAKQASGVAKALTTPRNKNKISNPEIFRSVRNPKGRSNTSQNKYGVAKALKFPSPKKVAKNQISSELNTPIRKICAGMKNLDIMGQKRNILGYETPLPLAGAKKKLGGKEVKSRVYDSLRSEKCKGREIKTPRRLKEKGILKDLPHCSDSATNEGTSGDSSDMDVDDKFDHRFSEACTVQERSKNPEVMAQEECLTNIHTSDKISGQSLRDLSSITSIEEANEGLDSGGENVSNVAVQDEKTDELTSHVEEVSEGKIQDNADKTCAENDPPANDEENGHQDINNDDKENASAPDNNREQDGDGNRKILSKLDNYEKHQKVAQSTIKSKKIISADKRSAQGGKYVKPRPTNPKPFRLRTDERGVLKEMRPLKDNTTASGFSGGSATKKDQSTQMSLRNGQFSNQSNHNHQSGKTPDDCRRIASTLPVTSKGEVRLGATTPQRYTALKQQKNLVHPVLKSRKNIKETRSLSGSGPERPGCVPARQLGVIKETSSTDCEPSESLQIKEPGASSATKASDSSGAVRSLSRGRRLPTIPKEPKFHSIHVPKSCIMKLT